MPNPTSPAYTVSEDGDEIKFVCEKCKTAIEVEGSRPDIEFSEVAAATGWCDDCGACFPIIS